MGLINKTGYSYNDLTIIPESISTINSRLECNPFLEDTDSFLPIFTAPMASVVNDKNIVDFLHNGIIPILPRNIDLEIRKEEMLIDNTWVALSLKEFNDLFINHANEREKHITYNICVDIANGHMEKLYSDCLIAKQKSIEYDYDLIIMTGNIANPKTYRWICDLNYSSKIRVIDYIRVGIGGGSGCITTSNVSIHYPQASLIDECYKERQWAKTLRDDLGEPKFNESLFPKIVADGGIRNYDHVIKALALGADYVMVGSLFAQCIESAGEKILKTDNDERQYIDLNNYEIINKKWYAQYKDNYITNLLSENEQNEYEKFQTIDSEYFDIDFKNNAKYKMEQLKYLFKYANLKQQQYLGNIEVKFFGMASADGQKSINGKKAKTSEGITKYLPVKYTLKCWVDNMISYLRSAMSYTNCKTLNEFIGTPQLIINSISEINAVNK